MLTMQKHPVPQQSHEWKTALKQAARASNLQVVGIEEVKNEAHARVGLALLSNFGQDGEGFLYFEPSTAYSTLWPPDVVLCHPSVGVLVMEVKAFCISQVERVNAGRLYVRTGAVSGWHSPFEQVRTAMFHIKDAIRKVAGSENDLPALEYLVALPNISRQSWSAAGYHHCVEMDRVLFREDLIGTSLRARLERFVQDPRRGRPGPLSSEQIEVVQLAFGDSAVLNRRRPARPGLRRETLGAYFDEQANKLKHLSREQEELSRLEVRGHPRLIRGVAGSGKTVVLANMVARYIKRWLAQPDLFEKREYPRVAAVCFNRSLVACLTQLIGLASRPQIPDDVFKQALTVTHLNGLMEEMSKPKGLLDYVPISSVEDPVQRARLYRKQLEQLRTSAPQRLQPFLYDAIFVDEGQDFEEEEFRLLLDLIRPDPSTGDRTLVIFYDDAQNLYGRARPVWKNLGIDVRGRDRARVMKECFRNTREIVEFAFNILVGTCAPAHLRVQTRQFADVSYLGAAGLVDEGKDLVRVHFAPRRGKKGWEWPIVHVFSNREEETNWLASELRRLIFEEQVRLEDMLVLFPRVRGAKKLKDRLKDLLPSSRVQRFIQPYGKHADRDRYIFEPGHLTVSTPHGAKGYDAAVVFLLGCDLLSPAEKRDRAQFYVAATRAREVLYISGLKRPQSLLDECLCVLERLKAAGTPAS